MGWELSGEAWGGKRESICIKMIFEVWLGWDTLGKVHRERSGLRIKPWLLEEEVDLAEKYEKEWPLMQEDDQQVHPPTEMLPRDDPRLNQKPWAKLRLLSPWSKLEWNQMSSL